MEAIFNPVSFNKLIKKGKFWNEKPLNFSIVPQNKRSEKQLINHSLDFKSKMKK